MSINDPHDRYIRSMMQTDLVVQQFLQWFMPKNIVEHLNLSDIKPLEGTYIDESLSKSVSDMVFNCGYNSSVSKSNVSKSNLNPNGSGKNKVGKNRNAHVQPNQSRIIIFIEHQSTPQKLLVARVYHYMFAMIGQIMKSRDAKDQDAPLPDIYPIVFYNGKTQKYPYSTNLIDCFANPIGIMNPFAPLTIQLININEISTASSFKHGLAGIMTEAMKRKPKEQTRKHYISIISQLGQLQQQTHMPQGFTKSTIEYMMRVKPIDNLDKLVDQNTTLPNEIRGEAMTIAEAFVAKGKQAGKIEVAINMLKEGIDKHIVVKTTQFELSQIEQLQKEIDSETKH